MSKKKEKTPKTMGNHGFLNMKAEKEDFDRLVDEFLGTTRTYAEAYEKAEDVHEKQTGHRRYSNSESYRKTRSRRIRNRK